jgi:uncharacterized protein YqgC (DUF456 family)
MLSVEAAQRPADMPQVKRRLEFILDRPIAASMLGAVYGVVIGIFSLFPPLILFGQSLTIAMGFVSIVVAVLVELFIQKKLKIPKKTPMGFRLLGVLTGMLPFFLGHIFFGWLF